MNVLLIMEDHRHDQWILKPLIARMLATLGRPPATIEAYQGREIRGVDQALDWERVRRVIELNPLVHLFILCVDRDAEQGRRERLARLERAAFAMLKDYRLLLAENAIEELEAWLLAGVPGLPKEWQWSDIRSERDCKEAYYLPYATQRGVAHALGKGRRILGEEAAANYRRVCQFCGEDVGRLEERVGEWLTAKRAGAARDELGKRLGLIGS